MDDPSSTAPPQTPPGEVITFYSYKGGTGRSMLLANTAWQLASVGKRVLLIDWDLEAPGLHRYFKPFLGDDPELRDQEGVIEWITDYWDAFQDEPDAEVRRLVMDFADPRHYVRKLETGNHLSGGIDLLCAGRQNREYARAVADFDWTRLFEKLRGEEFIEEAKRILAGPGGYDYILVDSRTGVSDTSGFCTVLLADTLVVCFTYNNQSVIGASQIARDIKRQAEQRRQHAVSTGEARRFRLFAVPSRVDDLDPERLDRRQRHAWAMFRDLLTDVAKDQQPSYWLSVQVRNQGLFAYEEVLAACMNRPNDPQSVSGAVTQLTRHLTDDAFVEAPSLGDEQRQQLRVQFGTSSATVTTPEPASAWEAVLCRLDSGESMDSVLHSCFPLLIQLYTISNNSASNESSPGIVRSNLLELELTSDERRMSEILISMGIVHRRITDERTRALVVADDSIANNWSELGQRLKEQLDFMASREAVRQARRAWELSGRSLIGLRALHGEFSSMSFTDEQRSWLGRPNLQFLQAIEEIRAVELKEQELSLRLAATEAAHAQRVAEFRERVEALENRDKAYGVQLHEQAGILRLESKRSERNAVRFRSSLAIASVALVAVSWFALGQWSRLQAATEQRESALKEQVTALEELSAVRARIAELERVRQAEAALRYYGEGTRILIGVGKPTSRLFESKLDEAIGNFNLAIQADPSLGEAYRGRALARGNQKVRDIPAELRDWAAYYDRVPSLSGRAQLLYRAAAEPNPEVGLIEQQLAMLVQDAQIQPQPDGSPTRVAAELSAKLSSFPTSLQGEVKRTVDALRQTSSSPPNVVSTVRMSSPVKSPPARIPSFAPAEAPSKPNGPMPFNVEGSAGAPNSFNFPVPAPNQRAPSQLNSSSPNTR